MAEGAAVLIGSTKNACDACHRMKRKCEGKTDPPCVRCRALEIPCTFDKVLTKKGPMRTEGDRIHILERQMKEVQARLDDLLGRVSSPVVESLNPKKGSLDYSASPDPQSVFVSDDEGEDNDFHQVAETMFPLRSIIQKEAAHRHRTRSPQASNDNDSPAGKKRRVESNDFEFLPRLRRRGTFVSSEDMTLSIPVTRSDTTLSADPVKMGLISEQRAVALFNNFFSGSKMYLPVFDETTDTWESLRHRSSFAVTVVLMIAHCATQSMDADQSEPKAREERQRARKLRQHAEALDLAKETLFGQHASIEAVQGMVLLSSWTQYPWQSGNHALSMALDLGLHRCLAFLLQTGMGYGKTTTQLNEERPVVSGARVWLAVCKVQLELSLNYGRPILIPHVEGLLHVRSFLDHPLTTVSDSRCLVCDEIYAFREPLHHPLRLDPSIPDPEDLVRRAEANCRVEEWWTYWQKFYQDAGVPSDHFLVTELTTTKCYAALQINSPVLMGLRDGSDVMRLSPADKEAFGVTITAAMLLVDRVAHGSEGETLRYGNSFAHLGLVGAARYLLRLSLLSPETADPVEAQDNVLQLSKVLSKYHGFKFASMLEREVAKARKRTQTQHPSTGSSAEPLQDLMMGVDPGGLFDFDDAFMSQFFSDHGMFSNM